MKIFFVSTLHYVLTSRYLLVTSAYLYVTSGSFLLRLVIHMFFVLLWTNFCMFLNMNLSKAHISKTKSWYNAKRYITRFWKVRHCIFNIKSVRIINWQKTKKIVKYMFLPSIQIIDQTLRVNLLKHSAECCEETWISRTDILRKTAHKVLLSFENYLLCPGSDNFD